MAAGWLKKAVIAANTPKMSIITRLKMNVAGFQPHRDRSVLHASDVTKPDFCPRQWALMDLLGKDKKDEYISAALQATFDVGTATARLVTDKWLGSSAIGHWDCRTCGAQCSFCSKPEPGCKHQGNCNWEYREVNFVSQEYGISGSIDVMVDLGILKVTATELKIIRPEDFEKIAQPLPEHEIRTALYLKLISDSNSVYKEKINLHQARVLYVSRGYGKAHPEYNKEILPWKEFIVERNDERVFPILFMAKQLKRFRDGYWNGDDKHIASPHDADGHHSMGTVGSKFGWMAVIPSGICSLPTDKYAKTCITCQSCFSGEYPAGQPPLEGV